MIYKFEGLLDTQSDIVDHRILISLLEQVFLDNNHLAKLIICEVKLNEKKHEWEWYMNGTFCKNCGAAIGSGQPCR